MTIAYSTLAFGAWSSPYQLHPSLLLWLAILGLWPLATFSLSTFQVHILIQKVKQSHLDTINAQIQIMIENIETNKNTEDSYEKLDKAMGVQTKVQNISEWPFAFSSIITFIISTANAIIQLTFAIVNILNP
jgi:hypothetical protein